MSFDMKGKNAVLVVGGSSGIGRACCNLLANEQNIVYVVARDKEKLENLQKELPGTIRVIPYDLNNLDGIKSIFDEIKKDGVKLNGLIYTAGKDAFAPVKVTSTTSLQNVMNVNCFAFCEVARCFFNRQVSENDAGIVVISSIASLLCEKGQMAYSASKAALNSVVKTMAQEFASRRIRVNAILPAGVDTDMAASKSCVMEGMADELPKNNKSEKNSQFLGGIPADVVAQNALFLLSDVSAYTTGELLTIGAGYSY